MRVVIMLLALAVMTVGFGFALEYHEEYDHCGGLAPRVTTCVPGTGAYVRHPDTTWGPLKPNCLPEPFPAHYLPYKTLSCYAGSLELVATHAKGVYTVRCDVVTGGSTMYTNCTEDGLAPFIGYPFVIECHSYDLGSSTPGGDGVWACGVDPGGTA